jgi:assimilatory nitrate reductase catalytic subunit
MTRTGRLERLMAHQREPLLDVHPDDAARLGLVEGGLARIESANGETVLPIRLSTAQRQGEVFAAMHWTDSFSSAGPIGRLVQAATDPVSGQPELKLTAVRVTPVVPIWHGLALQRGNGLPGGGYYWARVPAPRGNVFDLAGWAPLPSGRGTESWVLDLLGAASAAPELVIYADPARGAFRYASFSGGHLEACLFLSRNAAGLPARDALASLLGSEIDPDSRTSLLAGMPPGTAPAEAGPMICACFGVGLRTLHETIASRRLTSVAEIGAALRAGTNCGSCLPELHAILQRALPGAILSV